MFYSYFLENNHYLSLISIFLILAVAYLFSNNRSKINLKLIGIALSMQFLLALFILKTRVGEYIFGKVSEGFSALYQFADKGTAFVFGKLADVSGPWGMIFAIKIVPITIFFAALTALLFHLQVIQVFVKIVSMALCPLFGTSGAETLCAVANSMLGQTEAPLLVKNYLERMTDSEILVVMISGMSTLSGPLLAVYGSIGVPMLHLLCASMMSVPGAILISKILMPETKVPETSRGSAIEMKSETANAIDAISLGTIDGLKLSAIVVAILITFISLIALINFLLKTIGFYTINQLGFTFKLSLKNIFCVIFGPIAYMLGIQGSDVAAAGSLLGKKLVINEFIAYSQMIKTQISERTMIILTYALAGFANFACIGIQVGGIGAIAPSKRWSLSKFGTTALLGGTLVNLMNAAIAALLI